MARLSRELAERLPAALEPLAALATNYAWAWTPDGTNVFRDLDPARWNRGGCNPRFTLETVPPHRLTELAADTTYVERVRALAARMPGVAATTSEGDSDRPIAYFCSEFGLHCSLPLYGGGLGVLAGDLLKAASDAALPLVGVGLLYRQGYFRQRLDRDGWQHEYWIETAFEHLPLVLVTGADGRPLTVTLPIRDRDVRVQVWRVQVGRVRLFLLDTDRDDNHPVDRWITARLYIGDRHTRLAQYAVLGIGGVRALAALGIRPALVHLNEGHAAFGAFERLGNAVQRGASWDDAVADVRRATVLTTHTPVAAGNEGYSREELLPILGRYVAGSPAPQEALLDLGRPAPGDGGVSLTALALRTSRAANGVSRRHAEVARGMWSGVDTPIGGVTNGVHVPTWMAPVMRALLLTDERPGVPWTERVDGISDHALWNVRAQLRAALVERVRAASVRDRLSRGEPPDYVDAAARAFDAHTLTIGFARRVATYKRLHLLTRLPERGLKLLAGPPAVQFVIAGKAHPQDTEAKQALQRVFGFRTAARGVGERVVFLEDYDLHEASGIVAGVDVWLNLPRPPMEASGTSGMKVVVNGGLNLSVLDGWWAEAYDGTNGWAIATPDADPETQDAHDAAALFDLLEREVVPLFYDRSADGVPHGWLARVRASLRTLLPLVDAARMLRDYRETLYA